MSIAGALLVLGDLFFPNKKEESSREPEPNPYLRRKYEKNMKGEPYSYKDYMEDMIAHPEEFEGILSPTGGPRTVEEYFAGNTCSNSHDDDFMTGSPNIDFLKNK